MGGSKRVSHKGFGMAEIKTISFTGEEFQHNLEKYVEGCQGLIDAENVKEKLSMTHGRRYVKVIAKRSDGGNGSRVFAFIDMNTGDILKPATWNAPAMHARGSIFADDFGLSSTLWTGPKYLQ